MGQRVGLVERERKMTKRRRAKRKTEKQGERTLEEREAKTLGDAAPEPPTPAPREPQPVQILKRVRCPYCKTADVVCHGTRKGTGLRYYTCRVCCDPGQGDMEPTRFKVIVEKRVI